MNTPDRRNTAIVLELVSRKRNGSRYFTRVSRGRLLTAWSLPGARFFPTWLPAEIEAAHALAEKRGWCVIRHTVTVAA